MDYKNLLLNRLLDKYEKSKSYIDGVSNRRILINMLSKDFLEYDIEKPEIKELINSIIFELKDIGCIDFEWKRFEKGNIIEKVWLNLENIKLAYEITKRQPKRDKIENILELLEGFLNEVQEEKVPEFIKNYISETYNYIKTKKKTGVFIPEDINQIQALLKALKEICNNKEQENLERVFSIKLYGDSKYFERNIKKRLIDIIKKYALDEFVDEIDKPSDDEILSIVGIVKNPEEISFCGNIGLKIRDTLVDFSVFKDGISINSKTVKDINGIEFYGINKVLFIENKTNYYNYILKNKKDDEIIIYHGGFYSPTKETFFTKLYNYSKDKNIEYLHWSDIDIGGFRIFVRLKKNIIPSLKPYMMDEKTFIENKKYWMTFDKRYEESLMKLLKNPDYELFYGLINLMLQNKARLEQEAYLVSW
ncbi:Wadjet anti-phage system protein JetD domain-containing protein [Caldicellulosiruptoraceae bacterium PP1]